MGRALELLVGQATAPGTTFTGLTMNAGNSLTVRSAAIDAKVYLIAAWTDVQAAGTFRIRSPRLHDNVQGLRFDTIVSDLHPLLPAGFKQPLMTQDVLVAEITGSATAGDLETGAMLVYYEDLPGIDSRLITWDTLQSRLKHLLTVENTLALGTGGGYSGEEAINAEFDLLKANTEYALLGYLVDTECACVRWRGSDFGNLGVGGPGDETHRHLTREWFTRLARLTGLPLIPTFNAANKGGVLIDGCQDEIGTDTTVITILGELGPAI